MSMGLSNNKYIVKKIDYTSKYIKKYKNAVTLLRRMDLFGSLELIRYRISFSGRYTLVDLKLLSAHFYLTIIQRRYCLRERPLYHWIDNTT